jgi:osmotically inducible lipoprotein OsmB
MMTRKNLAMAVAITSLLGLSACGESTSDRALSGAGIGAATGFVGGALVGAPLEGAAIGGAVGAGTGAVTDKEDLDLGDPAWKKK